jgi:nucleotide-binding universal stress UspA family protein
MFPFKKILITTDGSDKTGPSIIYGLDMAKVTGAEVTALCVIDESDYEDPMNTASPDSESVLYQQSMKAVGSIVDQGKAKGLHVRPLVISGIPASEIAQASTDHDLTVMGTAGRTGISHLLLGSVAEKVIRSANSPVLVVHVGDYLKADRLTIKRILIPTDGSENTTTAITQGIALAKVFGAEVTALSVADQAVTSRSKANEGVGQSSLEVCREATDYVANEGRKLGLTVIPLILTGTPSDEIVKASVNYDLIVMGTVGRTGLAHIRLGSVAERTVRQAKCPVLVVRAKEAKTPV